MKLKKLILSVVAITTVAASAACLAACSGGAKEATVTGEYVSSKNEYTYANFRPDNNFYYLTVTSANLKIYDNSTYVYFVHTSTTSNINTGADVASDKYTANSGGYTITYYYGTYTAEVEEGLSTLTLAKPTRVVYSSSGNVMTGAAYYDTANWTEAMGEAYKGDAAEAATADKYLSDKTADWDANGEMVLVSTVTGSISGQFEIFHK